MCDIKDRKLLMELKNSQQILGFLDYSYRVYIYIYIGIVRIYIMVFGRGKKMLTNWILGWR